MGWLRAAVGVVLLVAPEPVFRLSGREEPSPASMLLMRTIGIRDLVLGLGGVRACRGGVRSDARRWLSAGLASDGLDVLVALASKGSVGERESAGAAIAASTFVIGDVLALADAGR
jgi:hypothetical protein